jgi:hypothetical protein
MPGIDIIILLIIYFIHDSTSDKETSPQNKPHTPTRQNTALPHRVDERAVAMHTPPSSAITPNQPSRATDLPPSILPNTTILPLHIEMSDITINTEHTRRTCAATFRLPSDSHQMPIEIATLNTTFTFSPIIRSRLFRHYYRAFSRRGKHYFSRYSDRQY